MTRKIGNTLHIENTPLMECEMCKTIAELRPYGPSKENICFPCAMKDEEAAERAFTELMEGPGEKLQ